MVDISIKYNITPEDLTWREVEFVWVLQERWHITWRGFHIMMNTTSLGWIQIPSKMLLAPWKIALFNRSIQRIFNYHSLLSLVKHSRQPLIQPKHCYSQKCGHYKAENLGFHTSHQSPKDCSPRSDWKYQSSNQGYRCRLIMGGRLHIVMGA